MIRLIDAEERARKSPTFKIPPEQDRRSLRPGDCAKVIFDDKERMWIRVAEVHEGHYVGSLSNVPEVVPLRFGAQVIFEPKHVIAIDRGTEWIHEGPDERNNVSDVCRDCNDPKKHEGHP